VAGYRRSTGGLVVYLRYVRLRHNFKPLALDQIMKGAQSMMHSVALLKDRVETLERANQALSKRRMAKRTRIHQGGSLTVQGAQGLLDQKSVDGQVRQEMRQNGGPGWVAP
jgi:hypothetical protein